MTCSSSHESVSGSADSSSRESAANSVGVASTKPESPADRPAVQTHIMAIQGIITRLAGNSTACKNWCITVVVAIPAVLTDQGRLDWAILGVVPVLLLFGFLDTYYLALERKARTRHDAFVGILFPDRFPSNQTDSPNQSLDQLMFDFNPGRLTGCDLIKTAKSMSIWLFYLITDVVFVVIYAVKDSKNWLSIAIPSGTVVFVLLSAALFCFIIEKRAANASSPVE